MSTLNFNNLYVVKNSEIYSVDGTIVDCTDDAKSCLNFVSYATKCKTVRFTESLWDCWCRCCNPDGTPVSVDAAVQMANFVFDNKDNLTTARERHISEKYGDAEERKAYVEARKRKALEYLDENGFVYEVNKDGKISFAPTSQQVNGISKAEFKIFRENFRKQFPYA